MKIIHNCSVLELSGTVRVMAVAGQYDTTIVVRCKEGQGESVQVRFGTTEHTEDQRKALVREIAKHLGSDDVFEITDDLKLRKVSTGSKKVQSEILDELITKFKELSNTPGNEAIRCSRMHFDGWADDLVAIREGVTT